MRDLNKMRERFMRDGLPVRMGNLASNLARLGNLVMMRHDDRVVRRVRHRGSGRYTARNLPLAPNLAGRGRAFSTGFPGAADVG